MAALALVVGAVAQADPVPTGPAVPAATSSKDEVSAALRASEVGERSVVDAFDADPAREAAANAKANADKRAALAALGLQSTQRPGQPQASRQQGGSITDAGLNGAPAAKDGTRGTGTLEPDPLKEAVRPLYDEVSKSGIADAVRGLKADLKAQLAGAEKPVEGGVSADGTGANGKSKDGTTATTAAAADPAAVPGGPSIEFIEPPKSLSQVEHDRMLAAASMQKLIDQVKPWAIGLAVLACLTMAWRMMLRYMRALEERRRRRFRPSGHPPQARRSQSQS